MYQYGFTENVKTSLMRDDAIVHPLFTPFRSESEAMHSTNLFTIADASYREELRAKFLADAIPATSFAAGANFTGGLKDNYNMQSGTPNGWPRVDSDDNVIWQHSDIKNVAFYFTFELFKKINEGK